MAGDYDGYDIDVKVEEVSLDIKLEQEINSPGDECDPHMDVKVEEHSIQEQLNQEIEPRSNPSNIETTRTIS